MTGTGYVTVLDYYTEETHVYQFYIKDEEIEDFIKAKGHNIKHCEWMITDTIKLTIH